MVNFDASPSSDSDGSIAGYSWLFGDGSTATGQQVSHSYTNVGNHSVTLTVTDNEGAIDNATPQTISVWIANNAPTALFSVDTDSGEGPLTVNFDASASGDSDGTIVAYGWDFGDGSSGNGQTVAHSYTTPGVYLATLTVRDDDAATKLSTAHIIRVLPANQAPTAAFSVDTDSGTTPLTVNFDASGSTDTDGSIVSYAWDFGDGDSGVGQQVSHTYTSDGSYTATLTVTDNAGAEDSDSDVIDSISASHYPTARYDVDVDSGPAPLTVSFDASTSSDPDNDIINYFWQFGDGDNASGVTTSHTYTVPGSYDVQMLATDSASQGDVADVRTITVQGPNTLPTAAFTVDVNSGTSPVTVNFDATTSSDSDGSVVGYGWDFGDGFQGSGASTTHTYFADGTHTAILTVTDDRGGQHSVSHDISVAASGGVTLSGVLGLSGTGTVDSDVNDINADYQSNNTTATAQLLISPSSLGNVWGFVSKTATGIEGERFTYSADEVDIYRAYLPVGQRICLTIKNPDDETGLENANDLDLYLYSVDDPESPVATALGTHSSETLHVPTGGEYYIVVAAYRGKSTYKLATFMDLTSVDEVQTLRLEDDFVPGQVIAKLKSEVVNPPGAGADKKGVAAATAIESVSSRGSVSMIRGAADRASLFSVNDMGQNSASGKLQSAASSDQDESEYSLLDGRYGIGLSQKDREAFETIKAIKRLRQDSRIDYAEPNYIQKMSLVPDDLHYEQQWHYPAINLPDTWDITTGDASVIVAVIDSGVFMAHEDLSGNLLSTGYDFIVSTSMSNDGDGIDPDPDPDDPGDIVISYSVWHGTHVAGTIAASTNTTTGVAGVAPDVRIMPIRVLGEGGSGASYDVAQGILYAAGLANDSATVPPQAADIINLSLGGAYVNQASKDAISAALNAGVIVIAAKGNDGSDAPHYPSDYEGVVSVGALGMGDEQAYYSNYGPTLDLVAPGGDSKIDADNDGKFDSTILSTSVDVSSGSRESGYDHKQGTSMATPHVAGVIALMKSVYSELTPTLLTALIENGAITTDLSGDGAAVRNDTYGYGKIDALKAVQQAQAIAGGATPPVHDEVGIIYEIDNMVLSSSQTISIVKWSGTFTVDSITLNYPWATLTPTAVDGEGFGDYQLDIDRDQFGDGLYLLDITFVMSNGDQYVTRINVTDRVSTLDERDVGNVYMVLVDESTLNVVKQIRMNLDVALFEPEVPFSMSNVPDGTYLLYAGTDFDGDRLLEDDEYFGRGFYDHDDDIFTSDISPIVVNSADIDSVSIYVGSTSADPVGLID